MTRIVTAVGVAAIAGWTAAPLALPAQQEPDWTQPVEPFRIAPHIYYVGTKGLSAYLITSKDGAILVDGTLQENAPLIERSIETVGVPLNMVKWIVSDHAHFDHVGAVAQIKHDAGAKFAASAGDTLALHRGMPRGDTHYAGTAFPPITIDRVVTDGQSVAVGDAVLTAHLTPGHTPGCTSWSTTVSDGDRHLDVLFLCSITVAGNVLVGNRAYPGIVLTSHPELADVLGREARVKAGDTRAFIDPTALPSIVAEAKAHFEAVLAQEKGTLGN
jgi:metallo-beta-lactamase class B